MFENAEIVLVTIKSGILGEVIAILSQSDIDYTNILIRLSRHAANGLVPANDFELIFDSMYTILNYNFNNLDTDIGQDSRSTIELLFRTLVSQACCESELPVDLRTRIVSKLIMFVQRIKILIRIFVLH